MLVNFVSVSRVRESRTHGLIRGGCRKAVAYFLVRRAVAPNVAGKAACLLRLKHVHAFEYTEHKAGTTRSSEVKDLRLPWGQPGRRAKPSAEP